MHCSIPSGFNKQEQFPQEFPLEVAGTVSLLSLAPKSPPLHHLVPETRRPPQVTSGTLKNRKPGPTLWILLTEKQDSRLSLLPPMPLCEMQASALPTRTKWVDLRAIQRPIPLLEKEGSGQSPFGESPTEKEMSELQKGKKVDV